MEQVKKFLHRHSVPGLPGSPPTSPKRAAMIAAKKAAEEEGAAAGAVMTGATLLRNGRFNKGTNFSPDERKDKKLEGLLPPTVESMELQVKRELHNLRAKPSPIEKYVFMMSLLDRNQTLFYRLTIENVVESMPILYTPTVGQACQEYHMLAPNGAPRGMHINIRDHAGRCREVLEHWPVQDVKAIVFTDGERILGLGDLGANGLGIPVGKLILYAACGGIPAHQCMPVVLDVGTNNQELLDDELYLGLKQKRVRGVEFESFVKEFMLAAQERYGRTVLLQFEDFGNTTAFQLLEDTRDHFTTFNDDIQGTAAVSLAGIMASLRVTRHSNGAKLLREHTILFLGAGEAGSGIANLIAHAVFEESQEAGDPITLEKAREKIWMVDSRGLVTAQRTGLAHHKLNFAHELTAEHVAHVKGTEFEVEGLAVTAFEQAVRVLEPTALIGVSAIPNTFTQPILEFMAKTTPTPVVFALSNPTSKAECTAEQAYNWTKGAAIFASGSPFDPVDVKLADGSSKRMKPGQGNNAYIFPGLGLAAIAAEALVVPDELLYVIAVALADQVSEEDIAQGCMYPPMENIREVSAQCATKVAERVFDLGISARERPADVEALVRSNMIWPTYQSQSQSK